MKKLLIIVLLLIACTQMTPSAALAGEEDEGKRFCFGWLWCREEKDGSVYKAAFLHIYSSEQRGDYSRWAIFPFYSEESDPEKEYLRRSILWPLGTYERKGKMLWSHVFPLYWHGREPGLRFTYVPPLYFDIERRDWAYFQLLPFYAHRSRGDFYDQYFILGPLLIVTRDAHEELAQWDLLFPLFSHRKEKERGGTRLLPIYFSSYDDRVGLSYRYLLPLYGQIESLKVSRRFFFPLYGSEEKKTRRERRVSLIGLPPISALRPFPTLALYEHLTAPDRITDRFFPVYRYARWVNEKKSEIDALLLYRHRSSPKGMADRLFPFYRYERDRETLHTQFSLIGYRAFSLYWYKAGPELAHTHLFPLFSTGRNGEHTLGVLGHGVFSLYRHRYSATAEADRLVPLWSYANDHTKQEWRLRLLGVPPFTLYGRWSSPEAARGYLFPLYDYRREGAKSTLSLGGVWELALYRHTTGPTLTRDRLVPLYAYANDHTKQEWRLGLLGIPHLTLYQHRSGPSLTVDRLFPFYGYRSNPKERRFSLLGFPPTGRRTTYSLYEHAATPSSSSDRFFPLYSYFHNRETGELRWDALFVYRHRQTATYTKDAFLPLHYYEHDHTTGRRRLSLIGVPPVSLFRYEVSPLGSLHYLFPLYSYSRDGEHTLGVLGYDAFSLYRHRHSATVVSDHLTLLWRYEHDRARGAWQLGLLGVPPFTLYGHRSGPEASADHLLPLYGYKKTGGVSRLSALGLPPLGDFPALALYEHAAKPSATTDRFLPVYLYTHDHVKDESLASVLLLYWRTSTPNATGNTLFPLFSLQLNRTQRAWRLTAVGLDPLLPASFFTQTVSPEAARGYLFPLYDYHRQGAATSLSLGGVWEFSLYRHTASPTLTRDRLVPLYAYAHDHTKQEWRFGLLGVPPLTLFGLRSDPESARGTLFPLYDFRRQGAETALSLGGVWEFSLYRHTTSPTLTRDRLVPLYAYANDKTKQDLRLGLLGVPPFTLYGHRTTPDAITDRLFPFYRYNHDLKKNETNLKALLLFSHKASPAGTWHRLWPFYSYADDRSMQERRIGMLGVAPISLYQHVNTPDQTTDRFVPFYTYAADRSTGEGRFSILWPLVDYRSQNGTTRAFSTLWWLVDYERPDDDHREFHILGGTRMALVSRTVAPERSTFEFSPVIPVFRYESEHGRMTEFNMLGFGVCTEEGRKKVRAFWFVCL
jgi:hypothetical protein